MHNRFFRARQAQADRYRQKLSRTKRKIKAILQELTKETKKAEATEEVEAPPKETVTATIDGIDIMELEDAVQVLWKEKIYAESGMGCTGPIVMINEAKVSEALKILSKAGYDVGEPEDC